jgi:predicted short-subunit dehydrogenase-like oxidoreductase (DUF2520 family)
MARRKESRKDSIAIVGPGRLGQAMGKLLHRAGFPIRFVAARRRKAAQRASRFIGSGRAVALNSLELAQASIFLLSTSDSALSPVAERLAQFQSNWKGKVVLHTSGSVPASVLAPLRRRGAAIGSVHPYQTIPSPTAGVRNLPKGYWGIEGDASACRVAKRWVKALDGVSFRVRPSRKILYHASAFLVCPTLVTLMDRSMALLRQSGVPARIARPMLARFVSETVGNFEQMGARKALTGPASRGDWPVIRRHLRALGRSFPDIVPVYLELLRAMLRLAGRRLPRDLQGLL